MKEILIAGAAVLGAAAVAGAVLHLRNRNARKDICMIAHRGHSAVHPGNTEPAFLSAVKNGSGGIETDVRMTADGVFVVNHDGDVVFEDGTKLVISESTYAQLTEKPIKNTKTKEKIYLCTFRRYLEICRDANMICFIELKGNYTDQMIHDVFTLAGEVYDLSMCQLQSFSFDNLIRAHEAFPTLKIMLTYGKHDPDYHRCLEYGFDIDSDFRLVTKTMVEEFHSQGLKVGAWTANSRRVLNRCRRLGVDFIESDIFGGLQ